ncbi:MAG: glycosyltransferase [Lachnospiraceae bacterium]|nr:glycosyltransferase [Lachnospiraceae bacterium]
MLPVAHENIKDHRKQKSFSGYIRLSYLGSQGSGKGFYLLRNALDEVWQKNKNVELNIFFHVTSPSPYMRIHDRYSYDHLGEIMENTDVLVVPSIWLETFGYPVPEALSCGVPVIVSGTVGARDIIPEGCGIIIDDMNSHRLAEVIAGLTADGLSRMNRAILEKYEVLTIERMNDQLMARCYSGGTGL